MEFHIVVPYRIFLPTWVLEGETEREITEKARSYISESYPERSFVRVEGRYAICYSR